MKLFFSTAATLVLMVFAAGCATTGMQRSENTSTKMKIVEQDIENAAAQVDMTRASLEELFRPGQADVKKAFELYSDNVAKMEELGKKFLNHTAGMSNQGKQYFEEWRKENNAYTDPEIQALSEQRRSDLSGIFDQIAESSVGVKGSLET
jgi:ABC-type Zn uptake system ZnuABC Zn-binding protein ZnuA